MGEVTISYIQPTKVQKNEERTWIHSRFLTELDDRSLAGLLLCVKFVKPNPITIKACNLGRFFIMRDRELTEWERATMVRALREYKIIGMEGNDFVKYAKQLKREQIKARQERLALVRRLKA